MYSYARVTLLRHDFFMSGLPTQGAGRLPCSWERPSIRWSLATPALAVSSLTRLRRCHGTDVREILAWSKPSSGSSILRPPLSASRIVDPPEVHDSACSRGGAAGVRR